MTLVQLRYLAAIVEAGLNISLAAQHTHSTQPGLSKQVGQIEDELGFKVFVRRGKRLESLTPAGAEVIEHAKIILAQVEAIQALAASRRRETRGELRIATTPTQARFVLAEALGSLRGKFPDIALHIAASSEAEALEAIEQDAANLAIVSAAQAPRTGCLVVPLYRWDLIGLVPKDHPLAERAQPLTLEDLAGFPLMTYESARSPGSAYARAFAERGLQPALAATARDSEIIKGLARSGTGVGLLAEMAWTPDDADLVRLEVGHLFESRIAWAVMPRDLILHNHVLELLTAIAPHLPRAVLRKGFDKTQEEAWPQPPLWRDLRGPAPPRPQPSQTLSRPSLRFAAQG